MPIQYIKLMVSCVSQLDPCTLVFLMHTNPLWHLFYPVSNKNGAFKEHVHGSRYLHAKWAEIHCEQGCLHN